MNRNTTVVVLCGLLLVADAICIRQVFNVYKDLTPVRFALLLTGQVLMAFFLGTVLYTVVRKTFRICNGPLVGKRPDRVSRYAVY